VEFNSSFSSLSSFVVLKKSIAYLPKTPRGAALIFLGKGLEPGI
jgi:hypothetical protein